MQKTLQGPVRWPTLFGADCPGEFVSRTIYLHTEQTLYSKRIALNLCLQNFLSKIFFNVPNAAITFSFSLFRCTPAPPVTEYRLCSAFVRQPHVSIAETRFWHFFQTFAACLRRSSESHDRFKVYYFLVGAIRICENFSPDSRLLNKMRPLNAFRDNHCRLCSGAHCYDCVVITRSAMSYRYISRLRIRFVYVCAVFTDKQTAIYIYKVLELEGTRREGRSAYFLKIF